MISSVPLIACVPFIVALPAIVDLEAAILLSTSDFVYPEDVVNTVLEALVIVPLSVTLPLWSTVNIVDVGELLITKGSDEVLAELIVNGDVAI